MALSKPLGESPLSSTADPSRPERQARPSWLCCSCTATRYVSSSGCLASLLDVPRPAPLPEFQLTSMPCHGMASLMLHVVGGTWGPRGAPWPDPQRCCGCITRTPVSRPRCYTRQAWPPIPCIDCWAYAVAVVTSNIVVAAVLLPPAVRHSQATLGVHCCFWFLSLLGRWLA